MHDPSFQVELLFRRALNDPNGLYTLAFIDELDDTVAVQSYEILLRLIQEQVSRGWLVYPISISKF